MQHELSPPISLEPFLKSLDAALSAMAKKHTPRRAAAFTHEQLFTFWATAPNDGELLRTKAIALVGFFGCARSAELVDLLWSDVREAPGGVWIKLTRKKCAADAAQQEILIPRLEGHRIIPADIFLLYKRSILSTPVSRGVLCQRIWRRWQANKDNKSGHWVNSPLGKESIKKAPKMLATYLGLNPEDYRGHSWRPSGATAMATNGGTAAQLQTAGNWVSLGAAQQYIRDGADSRKKRRRCPCWATVSAEHAPEPCQSSSTTRVSHSSAHCPRASRFEDPQNGLPSARH